MNEIDNKLEEADELERSMKEINTLARSFSKTLTQGLASAVTSGRDLKSVFADIALSLSQRALTQAFSGLQESFGQIASSAAGSFLPFAKGGVINGGDVVPFAAGGVVSTPTFFPMSGGQTGVMGEAGSEAIMPLTRGADGRLGVAASGQANAPSIVVNVATQDAASFKRSQTHVSSVIARAVGRGQRGL
ncbi:phage tail tape measure protein [Flexibacterium corallicola]|uniref:phage tail tape measure protein n=1 Tax=Flexibacterium corallicola TaxID=3037259 RepID=UPI00286F3A30|nr:phage tail tape measure protein [Pseudovibrio sp. M1P-2-3]